jgi:hypothetical protein
MKFCALVLSAVALVVAVTDPADADVLMYLVTFGDSPFATPYLEQTTVKVNDIAYTTGTIDVVSSPLGGQSAHVGKCTVETTHEQNERAEVTSYPITVYESIMEYRWTYFVPADLFDASFPWALTSQWKVGWDGINYCSCPLTVCWSGSGIFNDLEMNPVSAADEIWFNFRVRAMPKLCMEASTSHMTPGRWLHFKAEIFWTKETYGYAKYYLNDSLIEEFHNIRTLPKDYAPRNTCCAIHWSVGIYTDLDVPDDEMTIYVDDLEIWQKSP